MLPGGSSRAAPTGVAKPIITQRPTNANRTKFWLKPFMANPNSATLTPAAAGSRGHDYREQGAGNLPEIPGTGARTNISLHTYNIRQYMSYKIGRCCLRLESITN